MNTKGRDAVLLPELGGVPGREDDRERPDVLVRLVGRGEHQVDLDIRGRGGASGQKTRQQ